MADDALSFLVNLKPEEIIKWFESKGYKPSWNWHDTWKEAHSKSFTVAKAMKLDILQEIRNEVEKIFNEGITYQQFKKDLEPELQRLGWWGKMKAIDVPGYSPALGIDPGKMIQLGSPRRLKIIYETNQFTAYNAGRFKSQWENRNARPYLEYIQVQRPHKREEHALLHGHVFRINDPIIKKIYPPNGFGCACRMRALSKDELKERRLKVTQGSRIDFKPAEGWDFNPGISSLKINFRKYDKDIAKYAESESAANSKGTAAGKPVSDALSTTVRELKKILSEALAAIDSIHGDGELPALPVVKLRKGSALGNFVHYQFNGKPVSIGIYPKGSNPRLTALHEIGHFLDYCGIGVKHNFASANHELLKEWNEAVSNSDAIKKIRNAIATGEIKYQDTFGKSSDQKLFSHQRSFFEYLNKPWEIFARSYAQYIAYKTNNEGLLKELEEAQSKYTIYQYRQWEREDFNEIEKAFDNLFIKLGWVR